MIVRDDGIVHYRFTADDDAAFIIVRVGIRLNLFLAIFRLYDFEVFRIEVGFVRMLLMPVGMLCCRQRWRNYTSSITIRPTVILKIQYWCKI